MAPGYSGEEEEEKEPSMDSSVNTFKREEEGGMRSVNMSTVDVFSWTPSLLPWTARLPLPC